MCHTVNSTTLQMKTKLSFDNTASSRFQRYPLKISSSKNRGDDTAVKQQQNRLIPTCKVCGSTDQQCSANAAGKDVFLPKMRRENGKALFSGFEHITPPRRTEQPLSSWLSCALGIPFPKRADSAAIRKAPAPIAVRPSVRLLPE